MPPEALYEPPFPGFYHAGPDALFANRIDVIKTLFEGLETAHHNIRAAHLL